MKIGATKIEIVIETETEIEKERGIEIVNATEIEIERDVTLDHTAEIDRLAGIETGIMTDRITMNETEIVNAATNIKMHIDVEMKGTREKDLELLQFSCLNVLIRPILIIRKFHVKGEVLLKTTRLII